jgi:hypothetical protein
MKIGDFLRQSNILKTLNVFQYIPPIPDTSGIGNYRKDTKCFESSKKIIKKILFIIYSLKIIFFNSKRNRSQYLTGNRLQPFQNAVKDRKSSIKAGNLPASGRIWQNLRRSVELNRFFF